VEQWDAITNVHLAIQMLRDCVLCPVLVMEIILYCTYFNCFPDLYWPQWIMCCVSVVAYSISISVSEQIYITNIVQL